jgi:hypothetical protein
VANSELKSCSSPAAAAASVGLAMRTVGSMAPFSPSAHGVVAPLRNAAHVEGIVG